MKKNKFTINEKNISKSLYTGHIPDPDLLIRTGGMKRLSNFLLWQISYSEIFFLINYGQNLRKDFLKIISDFKKIKRNFGKI